MELENVKILLVEDNKWNREIAVDLLADLGAIVECVENGQEAIERLSPNPIEAGYALVLMDVDMPVMNGYEATRKIREMESQCNNEKQLPIIAMTAYAFEEDKQNALDSGMNGHVAKPVRIDILKQVILKVIE